MSFKSWWFGLARINQIFIIVAAALLLVALTCFIIGIFVSNNKSEKIETSTVKEKETTVEEQVESKMKEQQKHIDGKIEELQKSIKVLTEKKPEPEKKENNKDIEELKTQFSAHKADSDLKYQKLEMLLQQQAQRPQQNDNVDLKLKINELEQQLRNKPEPQKQPDPDLQLLRKQVDAIGDFLLKQPKDAPAQKEEKELKPAKNEGPTEHKVTIDVKQPTTVTQPQVIQTVPQPQVIQTVPANPYIQTIQNPYVPQVIQTTPNPYIQTIQSPYIPQPQVIQTTPNPYYPPAQVPPPVQPVYPQQQQNGQYAPAPAVPAPVSPQPQPTYNNVIPPANYPPEGPAGQQYPPKVPTGQQFQPKVPPYIPPVNYPPKVPTGQQYHPEVPAGQQFQPKVPPYIPKPGQPAQKKTITRPNKATVVAMERIKLDKIISATIGVLREIYESTGFGPTTEGMMAKHILIAIETDVFNNEPDLQKYIYAVSSYMSDIMSKQMLSPATNQHAVTAQYDAIAQDIFATLQVLGFDENQVRSLEDQVNAKINNFYKLNITNQNQLNKNQLINNAKNDLATFLYENIMNSAMVKNQINKINYNKQTKIINADAPVLNTSQISTSQSSINPYA